MSTRSFIGTTDGNTYEGIYCHFNGYPAHMIPALATIIARDGAAAVPVLTGQEARARGGQTATWSFIAPEMPSPDTELPYPDRHTYRKHVPAEDIDEGLLRLYIHLAPFERSNAGSDGRGSVIEGYGSVSLDDPIRISGSFEDIYTCGMDEWVYLFTEDLTLLVFTMDGFVENVGRFSYEDLVALAAGNREIQERVELAECGVDYVACDHLAELHDDSVPEESRGLTMLQWLGREPLRGTQAVAVIVGGVRYEATGLSQTKNGRLSLFLKGGDALPVAKVNSNGHVLQTLPSIELVYPPVKSDLAEVGA